MVVYLQARHVQELSAVSRGWTRSGAGSTSRGFTVLVQSLGWSRDGVKKKNQMKKIVIFNTRARKNCSEK